MKKFKFYWNELKMTFWFIPVLILIISILMSIGFVYLDGIVTIPREGLARIFFVNSPDSARSILTTISGAMIGAAGTVFSITLVALTLASSQFGPRLVKNFMYVRLNQIVLGSYISTYLYCLLVLNAIRESNGYVFIPSISIFIAILAALINIILLIVFIHQIAVSIQPDKVIDDISKVIYDQVKSIFPEEKDEEVEKIQKHIIPSIKSKYQHITPIVCPKSGYLQYIDNETLLDLVSKYDGMLDLHYRLGNYAVQGLELGLLYTHDLLDKEKIDNIRDQFLIKTSKTARQDIEYSIYQMVEIAVRALSPGVNDPFTAFIIIDNLTAVLCYLAKKKFPLKYMADKEKNLRLITNSLEFEIVLDAAFNQIRQYSVGSASVIIKLMEALITINKFVKNENHKDAVLKHTKMVLNVGKASIKEVRDLDNLFSSSKQIIKE